MNDKTQDNITKLNYDIKTIDKTINMLNKEIEYYQYTNDRYVVYYLDKVQIELVKVKNQKNYKLDSIK